jgi:hypothetical protein
MPDNSFNITMQRRSYADALHARLPRITEIIRSQRIITKALIDGKQAQRSLRLMALADKAAHFAERLNIGTNQSRGGFRHVTWRKSTKWKNWRSTRPRAQRLSLPIPRQESKPSRTSSIRFPTARNSTLGRLVGLAASYLC